LPSPTAASITVRETLGLLDGAFASLSAGVARGEYALWLGSGLSRDRVIGLNGVLHRIIEFLRIRVDAANVNCPYKKALDEVLGHADLSADEKGRVSYSVDSATWPDLAIILQRLAKEYSRVLDVTVAGQVADYLLWDATSFPVTFSNEEPDAEHLCVGILAIEGVISEIASANWDGLLEAAAIELGHGDTLYRVCVTGADFRGPPAASRLLKFHGCAFRAIENEELYRPLLIARWSQIVVWMVNGGFELMKQELVRLAAQARTLMIGMSAQDTNIQQMFGAAEDLLAWSWSDDPPAHVFAEDKIGTDQRAVLQISYKGAFAPNEAAILSRSCIRAYAKPLLVALVLKVISSKLCALMREVAAPGLAPADFEQLAQGIDRLRNLAAEEAQNDKLGFVRALVRHLARAKAMLQEGRSATDARPPYRPISHRPVHLAPGDLNLTPTGQREAANALALLGLGHEAGHWVVQVDDPGNPRSGAIRVTSTNGTARVMFVAHTTQAVRLFKDGVYFEEDEDVILIHSTERLPQQQRSPSRKIGRPGKPGARHIEIAGLLQSASDLADLNLRFRREVAL
jgi:hypothetical protein